MAQELTRLQLLQIDCSSAAQHYVNEVLSLRYSTIAAAWENLRQAAQAVDAQMAYERAQGEIPPTDSK